MSICDEKEINLVKNIWEILCNSQNCDIMVSKELILIFLLKFLRLLIPDALKRNFSNQILAKLDKSIAKNQSNLFSLYQNYTNFYHRLKKDIRNKRLSLNESDFLNEKSTISHSKTLSNQYILSKVSLLNKLYSEKKSDLINQKIFNTINEFSACSFKPEIIHKNISHSRQTIGLRTMSMQLTNSFTSNSISPKKTMNFDKNVQKQEKIDIENNNFKPILMKSKILSDKELKELVFFYYFKVFL